MTEKMKKIMEKIQPKIVKKIMEVRMKKKLKKKKSKTMRNRVNLLKDRNRQIFLHGTSLRLKIRPK